MIEYDELEQRMVLKLLYYGPALSGKTTNLLKLHDILSLEGRGELMLLDTKDDHTIYFDLLPFFFIAPSGMKIKVKVYTVPGQVRHDATRNAVLARADGVTFIADSQTAEATNNAESFRNLQKNLALAGLTMGELPLVIQFNKRDLRDIMSEEEIRETWEPTGLPVFMASALEGYGVLETYRRLVELTYEHIDRRYDLELKHGVSKELFVKNLTRLNRERYG